MTVLYSKEFLPAAEILQWQSVGNIFKLASWPLGFLIAAMSRGRTFLLTEVSFNLVFVALVLGMLPDYGIFAFGPAFTFAYVVYFFVLLFVVKSLMSFRLSTLTKQLLAAQVGCACLLLVGSTYLPALTVFIAPMLAIITGIWGMRIVLAKIEPNVEFADRLKTLFDKVA